MSTRIFGLGFLRRRRAALTPVRLLALILLAAHLSTAAAQTVLSTDDHVIVLELAPSEITPGNLLDLQGHTIRFTPDSNGFRAANLPLQWDAAFGTPITGSPSASVNLANFQFPFAGQSWPGFFVGTNGNITFGADESAFYNPGRDRFLLFRTYADSMLNTVPIIAPLFRKLGGSDPDNVYARYVKESADRVLVTWIASEPYRDIYTFTSNPLINRFQATLYNTGVIELSYHTVAVKDGIVGVFPRDPANRVSWTLTDPIDPTLPDYIDVTSVTAEVVSASRLRITFTTRGPVLAPGDPRLNNMLYRVYLDTDAPYATFADFADSDVDFGVFGNASLQYATYNSNVDMSTLARSGNTISFEVNTAILNGATRFAFFIDSVDFDAVSPNFDQAAASQARLPEVLGTITDPTDNALPSYIDIQRILVSRTDNHSIRFSFGLRGAPPTPGDPVIDGLIYRIYLDLEAPFPAAIDFSDVDRQIYIYGGSDLQYHVAMDGGDITAPIEIDGRTMSFTVPLASLNGASSFAFFADAVDFSEDPAPFDQADPLTVVLPPLPSPRIDLSASTIADPARPLVYEAFSYPDVPDETQLACDVLGALGDRFDFLAFYSDFRTDWQESGAPGTGAIGNLVSGVTPSNRNPIDYCSAGQLQSIQGVTFIDTPMAAPSGTDLSGSYTNYAREVTLLAHELGHRWLSLVQAMVGGNPLSIGDSGPHWLFGLHAPAVFSTPNDVSYMGGSYWQDNGNGTYTNLSPAFFANAGYSQLDLYALGLLPPQSVASMFILQNLNLVGYDPLNHPIYTGTRVNFTINDIIAAKGPRVPAFAQSQRIFNVGLVGLVQPGATPTAILQQRLRGIRSAFTSHWTAATGGVGTMQAFVFPDSNCDGRLTAADAAAFALALVNPTAYASNYPGCPINLADVNRDGKVNGADIRAFVDSLIP